MNLWVKRVGQLAVVSVALFFFSCQDESSLLGFKNTYSKFKLGYVDIPVGSSVLLLDSIRTSNFETSNDVNRWLIGKYSDPKFGEIAATVFAEYLPLDTLRVGNVIVGNDTIRDTPHFDSVTLQISNDFYVYGMDGKTLQEIGIHELTEKLSYFTSTTTSTQIGGQKKPQTTNYFPAKSYYAQSATPYDATEIGSKQFNVNTRIADEEIIYETRSYKDSVQHFTLDLAYGQRLFDLAHNNPDSFKIKSFFGRYFKGFAFVPKQGQKVVGFTPAHDSTRIKLYYHTSKDTLALSFTFTGLASYNQVINDRSSSEFGLLNSYVDTDPADGQRYVQAGTGVVTKLDFSKFIEFINSDSIDRLAINSAELVIKNTDDPGPYLTPQNLVVRILKDNNRVKKLTFPRQSSAYQNDLETLSQYNGRVNFDHDNKSKYYGTAFDSTFTIMNDEGVFFALQYSKSDHRYKGTASLFFQQLFRLKNEDILFTKVALIPHESASKSYPMGRHINGKTLDRVTFNKDNITLRVYYTIPTVNQN